jgi:hypothetical protein
MASIQVCFRVNGAITGTLPARAECFHEVGILSHMKGFLQDSFEGDV